MKETEIFTRNSICKRLNPSRLNVLHESNLPFVSRIELVRTKLSNCSAPVSGFSDAELAAALLQVKSAIDTFRTHLPEVQTLGNPGLRDRHWEKISEIVGFPIKADAETTLAKIIDLNLTDYIRSVTGGSVCICVCWPDGCVLI